MILPDEEMNGISLLKYLPYLTDEEVLQFINTILGKPKNKQEKFKLTNTVNVIREQQNEVEAIKHKHA